LSGEEVVADNPKGAEYAGHYGDFLALYDRKSDKTEILSMNSENRGSQIAQINGRVSVIVSFKDLLICNKSVCKQIDGRFEAFGVLDFNPTSATVLAGYVVLGVACNTNIRIYEYSGG